MAAASALHQGELANVHVLHNLVGSLCRIIKSLSGSQLDLTVPAISPVPGVSELLNVNPCLSEQPISKPKCCPRSMF